LETKESGKPAVFAGAVDVPGTIAPGAIEYSTAAEFTKLCQVHPDCK
jgi:hypothetical protein